MQGYTLAYPVNPFVGSYQIIRDWKRGKVARQKTQGVAHWYIPRIRVLGRVGNARKASYKSWNARKAQNKSLPKDPKG